MQPLPHDDLSWTVAKTQAQLSEFIDRAQSTLQTITPHGKPGAVVISADQ